MRDPTDSSRSVGSRVRTLDPTYARSLHRRDRLEPRVPLADQRRRPRHRHEVIEGKPDEENEDRGIWNDQRPALARLVTHEEDDERGDRRNEPDDRHDCHEADEVAEEPGRANN